MAFFPNTKIRKTDTPNEWLVIFHGHVIGSIEKVERPNDRVRRWRLRWYAYGRDRTNSLSAGFRLREYAVNRVVRTYLEMTGSSSGRHNDYVAAVKNGRTQ